MMPKREQIRAEVQALYSEGAKLAVAFQKEEEKQFHYDYQQWYTKALKAVSSLAPDRLVEFKNYYEINSKRKSLDYGTYVIQDFMKNIVPSANRIPDFDSRERVITLFFNQLTILKAVEQRIDTVLNNIEGELYAELQDNEIEVARQLCKVNLRAAGSLVGVVIEGHLQKVAASKGIKILKKNPTIAELNDPLKAAGIIDIPAWRKISYLADIRNICSHKKDVDPTKTQVQELIDGAEWLTKNVL
jgi:hypothetical protein